MRCSCCNKKLSNYESTLRHAHDGTFLDTCIDCLDGLNIPVRGRKDLDPSSEEVFDEDPPWLEDEDPPF